jgi:glutamate transport system permease protein
VAAAFGVTEATYQLSNHNRDFPDELYLSFLGIAFGYIVIVAVVSVTANRLERRVAVGR